MTKKDLISLFISFAEGDAEAVRTVSDAYSGKLKIWNADEWIYVKDVEKSIKGLYRLYKSNEFDDFPGLENYLINDVCALEGVENDWARNRVLDCRHSLSNINSLQ
jgi:hypothetical protein